MLGFLNLTLPPLSRVLFLLSGLPALYRRMIALNDMSVVFDVPNYNIHVPDASTGRITTAAHVIVLL